MNIIAAGATDVGKRRSNNEDAFLVDDELRLYAVADGVGGSEGGEIASRIAVETLGPALPGLLEQQGPGEALGSAVDLANRNIRQQQDQNPSRSDMATTLTALLVREGRAYLAHVGDSRAYLLRQGKLAQQTNDHSFVAEKMRAGIMTQEAAKRSPYRHVITRALGLAADAGVEVTSLSPAGEDTVLLCTDGLTEMVDDAEIAEILSASAPTEAAEKLIAAANSRGGVDNITVVVVRIAQI